MKSVKKWHDYKAIKLGVFSQGEGTNCSYMAMFKALLLPNYISEQHNFSGMLVTLLKYWKNIIIYIVTIKDQRSRTPKVDCF